MPEFRFPITAKELIALPTYPCWADAYISLVNRGERIPRSSRRSVTIEGQTYHHPRSGERPLEVDTYALPGSGALYTGPELAAVLGDYHSNIKPLEGVVEVLRQSYQAGQVWGFAGYATPGYKYAAEARGIRALFGSLKTMGHLPSLVSYGGVDEGVLGLSSAMAEKFRVPRLGFLPREGLKSPGFCEYLAVHMDTYQNREQLVAVAPDVLVCVGGSAEESAHSAGGGTRRECERALTLGSVVLMLVLRKYNDTSLPATFQRYEAMQKGLSECRLIECHSLSDVQSAARLASERARQCSVPRRDERLAEMARLLAA